MSELALAPPHLSLLATLAIPALAASAVVLAILGPVLVHLLFRQRFRVIEWAAMRFLLAAKKKQQRRIDRWLLLTTRILTVLLPLLGMIAATPFVEPLWQSIVPGKPETLANAPRTHYILLLDHSLSMNADPGERPRLEKALELAEKTVRAANPGDGFSLVSFATSVNPIISGVSNDPDKVVAELRSIKPTHGSTDLTAALTGALDLLGKSPRAYPRRQILLFTDLQRSAWSGLVPRPDSAPSEIWTKLTAKAEIGIIDVAAKSLDNLAVSDLRLADPLPLVDDTAIVTASIQNFGNSDRRQVAVELLLARPSPVGGAEPAMLPIEQRVIDTVPAGGRSTVSFSLEGLARFRSAGPHAIQVKLTEPDNLPADDSQMLAFDVREGLSCLLINGTPSGDPFRRSTEYLLEALAPGGNVSPGNPARPRVINYDAFSDATLSDLSQVDCVFLCDLPVITPSQIVRLESLLKRGGGVVIALGPNSVAHADLYNRLLYADGNGLLPGKIVGVQTTSSADDPGFRFAASEDSFRRPPLAAFQDDNARGGLVSVPFRSYVKLDAPADGRGRRLLSFVPSGIAPVSGDNRAPDPAVIEMPRHRGRVIVYTSTLNREWTDWPVLPSFLPFAHETLRFAVTSSTRYTLRPEDIIEVFVPPSLVGLSATISGPAGTETQTITATEEGGVARFTHTPLSGLYRVSVNSVRTEFFAVNTPDSIPGGGSESELRQTDAQELESISTAIQVVHDPTELTLRESSDTIFVTTRKPHGPMLARWLVTIGLMVLAFELWLAWRMGPGRSYLEASTSRDSAEVETPSLLARIPRFTGILLLTAALVILASIAHASFTGELLGFLPDSWRHELEKELGVPSAGPGEGTRWRLESIPAYVSLRTDFHITLGLCLVGVLGVLALYRLESRAVRSGWRLVLPASMRLAAYALLLFVVLPQLRLAFDREGWPDVAILIDSSTSMTTVDDFQDPAVRSRAQELGSDLDPRTRVELAKALLTRDNSGWLSQMLRDRQLKIHVYSIADQAQLITTTTDATEIDASRKAIRELRAEGQSSRLGDAVQAVLKSFRGGSLSAMVILSDGVTTAGDDLATAGRAAARIGVPLYLVGLGDARDPLDLALSDLRADDIVAKNDELVFEARLTARGKGVPRSLKITLLEQVDGKLVKRDDTTVTPDSAGKPVPFRLRHVPTESGEKTYIIDVAGLPGEVEIRNNRIERQVVVTDNKKLRVLMLEGYPRYEFRFVKVLLERETDGSKDRKAVDLSTLLLDASKDHVTTDRSALRAMPTRQELFEYDVIILGDVDPAQLPRPNQSFQDLADFVRERGGGLMVVAGEQSNPIKLFSTPLGDILPVVPSAAALREPPRPTSEDSPIRNGYQPRLTPVGISHPLFRFASSDVESTRIWSNLKPLFWFSRTYNRKETAEVLAVHPEVPALESPGENHPLVLQQFVGSGRVLFLGFDETWRWRWRKDEEHFNTFWRQAIKVLSRNRISRVELRTNKQTAYRRDEPITLTAQFPDDAPPPKEGSVKVRVERTPLRRNDGQPVSGDTETQTLVLSKVENTRASFQTTLTRTPEGEYQFRLMEPATEGTRPRVDVKVLPPPGEMDRLEMNRIDLMRAATESRGKFYTLAEVDQVIADLPEVARLPLNQPCPPISLWNHIGTFVLVLLLLCNEWVLRKRERLL